MPLLAQANARPPPVQTTHSLPASPSPPTPKQLQLGHWGVGEKQAPLNLRNTHSLLPLPWSEGEPGSAPLKGARNYWGKERGGKKRL